MISDSEPLLIYNPFKNIDYRMVLYIGIIYIAEAKCLKSSTVLWPVEEHVFVIIYSFGLITVVCMSAVK